MIDYESELEKAAAKACEESTSVLLALRVGGVDQRLIRLIYQQGFCDGALHGLERAKELVA